VWIPDDVGCVGCLAFAAGAGAVFLSPESELD
jgi:hypothetical protein